MNKSLAPGLASLDPACHQIGSRGANLAPTRFRRAGTARLWTLNPGRLSLDIATRQGRVEFLQGVCTKAGLADVEELEGLQFCQWLHGRVGDPGLPQFQSGKALQPGEVLKCGVVHAGLVEAQHRELLFVAEVDQPGAGDRHVAQRELSQIGQALEMLQPFVADAVAAEEADLLRAAFGSNAQAQDW